MDKGCPSLTAWLLELINPPRRDDMTLRQKMARTLVITGTVVIGCIMFALIGASVLVLAQQVRHVTGDNETLAKAVAIILTSICGNVLCVITLMEIRRFDRENVSKVEDPPLL